ncbi:putative Cystatin domain-containing protein [Helianthus annuus]|uniref:Cysteine proteinase inhibitor n=1 Tax=Helianthus annuus TaxID=4232 RepID=A0A9K3NS93_HELAN|nr:cysteine proteinase inhibitor 12 isoform X2 [Helianthus annuus]KAF5811252.1 putative Cystatin domain-containing protein [Helianthus annuus]
MQIKRYNQILQLVLLLVASSSLFNSMANTLGGVRNSSSPNTDEIHGLARFAVDEHNKKENAMLKLARVVKVQEQVVAGTLHHLTLEVDDDVGNKKIYLAKVWVKPWLNFKELQEFNHIGEPNSDRDIEIGDGSGYQVVPVHDLVVQDAANHVLKTLQQRSNSLYPYELLEVVHAKAETAEGLVKYDILLKLKRNDKEEKFKANVHRDNEGAFHVNHMVQDLP